MTTYAFDPQLVADPVTFTRAAKASITVYDVGDTTNSTPLTLTDLSGLPLANPLTSTADAIIPAFMSTSPQVKLVGGGLTIPVGSFDSVLSAATAAQADAASSASSAASAASYAAGLLAGPLDGGNASSIFTSSFNFDGGTANG